MKTILETERLRLREMTLDDLDFLAELVAHPEVMKYWPKCYSRDEAANWIQRQLTRYAKDGAGYWLALEKASGRPGVSSERSAEFEGVLDPYRRFWAAFSGCNELIGE